MAAFGILLDRSRMTHFAAAVVTLRIERARRCDRPIRDLHRSVHSNFRGHGADRAPPTAYLHRSAAATGD